MRVISGNLKGKKISFINSETTRPLRDIVREGIFNILEHSNLIDLKIKNSTILDLYSGIGSFGIECVSRNAKEVNFVEQDKDANLILLKNINNLSIKDKVFLNNTSVNNFLENRQEKKYDIIFMDPPYRDKNFLHELKTLYKLDIVNKKHIVIIHREIRENINLSDSLNILFSRKYGRSEIFFGNLLV